MKILVAAIGKPKSGHEQALVEEYLGRLNAGRLGWETQLLTFESGKPTAVLRQRQEADWLLETTQAVPLRIALDERGQGCASMDFARRIAGWEVEGHGRMAFLLGGPDGHTDAVRAACRLMSLSQMTLPHLLARVLLMEQLYRAFTIQQNHPYHRA